ncbi:DNA ligase 1-like [Episyrphus balteatus]|uniref:DNA ligase 1-like n=1 Tax=Episyrphus balteatus TaxID=286459 RepID=UPI00248649FB|nr:DNA ligase 1-like [Episyrphus balteatus]
MNNSKIFYSVVAIVSLVLAGLATHAQSQEDNVVDDGCLACICDATSGCNVTKTCNGDVCGLFRITWFYWADGGKMTVNGDSEDSPMAFQNCATDPFCATKTVQNYMAKFRQDCNRDGKIDCYDFAAIHKLGGYGCPGQIFGPYSVTLNQCLKAYSIAVFLSNSDSINSFLDLRSNSSPHRNTPISEEPTTTATMISSEVKSDVTNSKKLSQNTENVTKMEEVPQIVDVVETFDDVTDSSDQTSEKILNNPQRKMALKADLPSLTLLQYLRPKVNTTTTTAPSVSSKKDAISENMIGGPVLLIPDKDDMNLTVDNILSILKGTNVTQINDAQSQTKEISQDRFFDLYERIEKSKNDDTDKDLSIKEKFLEAFATKNRIEKERNYLLNEITKNNKALGTNENDGQELQRRTIESRHDRFFKKLEEREKSEKEHREKELRFQEQFLEAFLKSTRVEEERNKVLKEIANSNKPSDFEPRYFFF